MVLQLRKWVGRLKTPFYKKKPAFYARSIFVFRSGLNASAAGEWYDVPWSVAWAWLWKYSMDGQVGRCRGTGLWHVSSSAQDAVLVAKAQRNPFTSARERNTTTNFLGQKSMVILRLKEVGRRAWHAAVKTVLTSERQLYCLAFAESSVVCQWIRVIFADKSTFSSACNELVLVYRPEHYNSIWVDFPM
jgi:hypothetical protein